MLVDSPLGPTAAAVPAVPAVSAVADAASDDVADAVAPALALALVDTATPLEIGASPATSVAIVELPRGARAPFSLEEKARVDPMPVLLRCDLVGLMLLLLLLLLSRSLPMSPPIEQQVFPSISSSL